MSLACLLLYLQHLNTNTLSSYYFFPWCLIFYVVISWTLMLDLTSAVHAVLTPLRLAVPGMVLSEALLTMSLPHCYVKTSDSLLFYFLNCTDTVVFFLRHCVCSSWQEKTCFLFYLLISNSKITFFYSQYRAIFITPPVIEEGLMYN